MKATPGPWEVREFGSEVVIDSLPGADGKRTRIAVPMFCDEMEEECEANAALIARAPMLAGALEIAEKALREIAQDDWTCGCTDLYHGTAHTEGCPKLVARAALDEIARAKE